MQRLTILFATREDLVPSVRTADDFKLGTVAYTDLSGHVCTKEEIEQADLILFREGDQFKLLKSTLTEAKHILSFKQAVTILDIHQAHLFEKTRPAPAPVQPVRNASAKQKEEIIRLLNNPVITRQEKTKMLLNINRFDEARAAQAIEKLKRVIEDREDAQSGSSGYR